MSFLQEVRDSIGYTLERRDLRRKLRQLNSLELADVIIKSSLPGDPTVSTYDAPIVPTPDYAKDRKAMRRAVHSMSAYWNTLGVFRRGFDKSLNDRLASSTVFAICEKRMYDYIRGLQFEVTDKYGNVQDDLTDFFKNPNPQHTGHDILVSSAHDLIRYDQAAIVKSFSLDQKCREIRAYSGPEFWCEIDREQMSYQLPMGMHYNIYASTGYITRYWQRSRLGVYVPFDPKEVCWMMMYPRPDQLYGTDFIKSLRYQIQYLLDSTKAAGKTFENGIVPSMVWKHPQVLHRSQLMERIKEVESQAKGASKFGSVVHLTRDEEVSTLSHKLHEMEWLDGQKFISQLVWAMWGFSSAEFIEGDVNRASAYINRNITKSSFLEPLLNYYEAVFTREVLPYLEGYSKDKGHRFTFVRGLDPDDRQKEAVTFQTQVNAATGLWNMGVPLGMALKLARVGDRPETMYHEQLDIVTLADHAPQARTDQNNPEAFAHAEGYAGRQNPTPTGEIDDTDNHDSSAKWKDVR